MAALHVDCISCTARGDACSDCVISVFLGSPDIGLADEEQSALAVLADAGLVPPLRLAGGPGEEVRTSREPPFGSRHAGPTTADGRHRGAIVLPHSKMSG